MIHYSNILPPIQYDSLIKRSTTTLYGVLCLIEESFVLSIKEQSNIIKAQSLKLKEMGLLAEDTTTMSESASDSNFTTKSTFSDTNTSTPNEIIANAYIYVFNLQGNLLLSYNLSDNGFGSVIINGSSLNAGMYIYSLTIGGQEVDTKRMMLTK